MADARYLIRLANKDDYSPEDQASLLEKARSLAKPLQGKVINLRVTPHALEFDLFCEPDHPLEPFFAAFRELGAQLTWKRLGMPPLPVDPSAGVSEARVLFNEHRFWEVHEVLEDLWKQQSGAEKQLIQGLILAAAALVHVQKNETPVAWPMFADALRRLEGQPDDYFGWNLKFFRKELSEILSSRRIAFPTV